MKAYILQVVVIDHDGLGFERIAEVISETRYPNHCISPEVVGVEERDIGEWGDSHPLNQGGTDTLAWLRQNSG